MSTVHTMNNSDAAMLELRGVSKRFDETADWATRISGWFGKPSATHSVAALDCVSLAIRSGEVLGLVGESGSGKSTLGRITAGLLAPSSGSVMWLGQDLARLNDQQKRQYRLAAQMVFQDPYASLNPRMRVADIVGEAPVVHGIVPASDKNNYAASLLEKVGLDPVMLQRFPHQFSGGQRARVGIARALAVRPSFLVCDEAVAALDVSIQAQVLNLFMQLRTELQLTYLFISHDLGVVRHVADRVAVMYLGRIVEIAAVDELFERPNHPYTITLLASMPRLDTAKSAAMVQEHTAGTPDPLQQQASGCPFSARCPHAMARCTAESPLLKEVSPNHYSACHLNDQS